MRNLDGIRPDPVSRFLVRLGRIVRFIAFFFSWPVRHMAWEAPSDKAAEVWGVVGVAIASALIVLSVHLANQ